MNTQLGTVRSHLKVAVAIGILLLTFALASCSSNSGAATPTSAAAAPAATSAPASASAASSAASSPTTSEAPTSEAVTPETSEAPAPAAPTPAAATNEDTFSPIPVSYFTPSQPQLDNVVESGIVVGYSTSGEAVFAYDTTPEEYWLETPGGCEGEEATTIYRVTEEGRQVAFADPQTSFAGNGGMDMLLSPDSAHFLLHTWCDGYSDELAVVTETDTGELVNLRFISTADATFETLSYFTWISESVVVASDGFSNTDIVIDIDALTVEQFPFGTVTGDLRDLHDEFVTDDIDGEYEVSQLTTFTDLGVQFQPMAGWTQETDGYAADYVLVNDLNQWIAFERVEAPQYADAADAVPIELGTPDSEGRFLLTDEVTMLRWIEIDESTAMFEVDYLNGEALQIEVYGATVGADLAAMNAWFDSLRFDQAQFVAL